MRILVLALLLGACATPCPPPTGPGNEIIATRYQCSHGQIVIAQFTRAPHQVEIRQVGYPDLVLPARPTGSGFLYASEGTSLQGQGAEARLVRPGGGELLCRSNP